MRSIFSQTKSGRTSKKGIIKQEMTRDNVPRTQFSLLEHKCNHRGKKNTKHYKTIMSMMELCRLSMKINISKISPVLMMASHYFRKNLITTS